MLGAALLLSPSTLASDHSERQKPDPDRVIDHLDTDGDRLLSLDEFRLPPKGRGRLSKADADGDGNITVEEMEAALASHVRDDEEQARSRFDEADGNNDDVVTALELKTLAFERIDANSDGYLSVDEFEAMKPRQGQRHPKSDRSSEGS
ncbi:EF hand domain protein [Luminiphilus syltensis NOR5-1B]|uniref:EF hand domain protein n=1 Tax=Luminiphilus syltensis NOR5-1B TaxID=565045 RepID=B8KWT4_9GAMM|nr:EF hand domain protein [Luminiphilus syltensis NOR5-1B]